jgi:hypothetical protein
MILLQKNEQICIISKKKYLVFIIIFSNSKNCTAMKKLLTIALFSLAFSSIAQVPDYFDDNPQWRQDWWFGGAMPCLEIYNYVYYLGGDSVVGDFTYKKVFTRGEKDLSWQGPWPPPDTTCTGSYLYEYLVALIRQDGLQMYINHGDNETLLYDFDLNVGDTLPASYFYYPEDDVVVNGIDSILIGDSYRKIFDFDAPNFNMPLQLIEGLGFNQGFLDYVPDWYPAQLMCFALDGVTYYPSYAAACDMVTGIDDYRFQVAGFSVFPNPASVSVSIELYSDSKANTDLVISDILGRNLLAEKWELNQGKNLKSINLRVYDKGIYFISITGENGERFAQQKLIVE